MEGFPPWADQPIGVEARLTAVRHHDEHIAVRGELLDVGRPGPALIGVTTSVQQIEHGPPPPGLRRVMRGQQQPDLRRRPQCRRGDRHVPHPRRHHSGRLDPQPRDALRGPLRRAVGPTAAGVDAEHHDSQHHQPRGTRNCPRPEPGTCHTKKFPRPCRTCVAAVDRPMLAR